MEYPDRTYGNIIVEGGKTYDDTDREFLKVRYSGQMGYIIAKFFSTNPESPFVTNQW